MRDRQDAPGCVDPRGEVRALAGQHVELAEEAARGPCNATTTSPSRLAADDLDLALEDDEEVVLVVAGAVEHVAGRDVALGPERRELRQLGFPECDCRRVGELGCVGEIVVGHGRRSDYVVTRSA